MFQEANNYNAQLTPYAQAAFADETESVGKLLFPPVGVPTNVGQYKKRDIDNAFRAYDAQLARGTSAKRIDVNATDAFYSCKPFGLAVGTWKFDMDQEGGDTTREENLQDLMSTQLVTREQEAVRLFREGVPAMSGAGTWSTDEAANIIGELNSGIMQVHAAIGRMPTHMVIGLNAWAIMQNHPALVNRISGIAVDMTVERLRSMLIHPGIKVVVAAMPWQPEARGLKGKKKGIVGGDVFIFYTQDSPTRNDLSVGKDFTRSVAGPEVISYEDEKTMETVDTLYWSSDRQVTCPAAGARIEVA